MNDKVKFLKDKPLGEDKFDGKSQERLSIAIANHIIGNDSDEIPMPRIIGIEGSWGSGKSNVVELVKEQLNKKKKDKYFFFEYDAWGNQEDLQRRSILEQLTSELVDRGILKGKTKVRIKGGTYEKREWPQKLQLLLSRKTETTSESRPKLNGGIVYAFIAGILTPITALVASFLGDEYKWYVQLFIAGAPIILLIIVWVISAICNNEYWNPSFLLYVYSDKIQKEHSYEVISEDEPSVVEFKGWMKDVSDNLNKKICDKLVIVFDNMDRLPAEKVKQLWSSIHTFFAESGFENIWVIIPYDKKHLSCAFGPETSKESIKLTQYFIDKTFPVTFNVPEPVITDYKGIFDKLLVEAFGDTLSREKADMINRLYRLCRPVANIREIIIFINRLVSLYKTRDGESIDIVSMAIYELYKDEIHKEDKTVSHILSGEYLGDTLNIINYDDNLKAEISALVYGVNIDIAKQIPLTEYIRNCINAVGDYDINKYADTDSNFDPILKEVYENTDYALLSKMIVCLDQLKKECDVVSQLWERLAGLERKQTVSSLIIPPDYLILFKHVKKSTKQRLADELCASWSNIQNFDGSKYVRCVSELNSIKQNDFDVILKEKDVDSNVFIDMAIAAQSNYKEYRLKCKAEEVDTYLSEKLPNDFTYYEVVKILFNDGFSTFDKTLDKLKQTISNNEITEVNAGQVFNTFHCLNTDDTLLLKDYMDEDNVATVVKKLQTSKKLSLSEGFIDLAAWSLSHGVDVELSEEQISQVANLIDSYITVGELIVSGLGWNIDTLNEVIKYMIENKLGKELQLIKLLPEYDSIRSTYDVKPELLWEYLSKWDDSTILDNITDESGLKKLIPSTTLYKDIASIDLDVTKRIKDKVLSILDSCVEVEKLKQTQRSYTTDYWHKTINAFLDDITGISMPTPVIEFTKSIYNDIPNGSTTFALNDYTRKLLSKVDTQSISSIFAEIRDTYCNSKKTITSSHFQYLEKGFRLHGVLEKRADEVVNKIIKPVIGDAKCKELIINNHQFYKGLIAEAKNIDEFKTAIIKSWDEEEYSQLGIEKPQQENDK
jgi:Cdc6-like AAA superfamily ATPase